MGIVAGMTLNLVDKRHYCHYITLKQTVTLVTYIIIVIDLVNVVSIVWVVDRKICKYKSS